MRKSFGNFNYLFFAVIVIVDVSNHWTRNKLHDTILQLLEEHKDKASILVLNKVYVVH